MKKVNLKTVRLFMLFSVIALSLLFVDQLTKLLAHYFLMKAEGAPRVVVLIPGFFSLLYTENDSIAFGIGSGNQTFMVCIMVLTVVLAIGIGVLIFTVFKKTRAAQIALCVIEAGAIGNFLDRLTAPTTKGVPIVRDFLDFSAFKPLSWAGSNFNFGICNVADLFIVFGAIALLIVILFIGPHAVFPATKKWREESKVLEEEKEQRKREKHGSKKDRS